MENMIPEQAMEIEELLTTTQEVERELFAIAQSHPDLKEMLGPDFFQRKIEIEPGEYVQHVRNRVIKLKVALQNLKFWEEYPWPEAMLKLLSTKKDF